MEHEPQSLQEAVIYFADPANCMKYMVARRWPNGVECPRCGSKKVVFSEKFKRWQCGSHHERRQFTLKTGTIFEDSPLGLDKWLPAVWLLCNCKNGMSSWELHRAIRVTQKTAWFMLHRVRLALQGNGGNKLFGEVEVDETFVGGKARNMHKEVRDRKITGTGGKDKAVVMGMLERGGEVRAMVVENRLKSELQKQIREHVRVGSALFTDELKSYEGLEADYRHAVINHAIEYVNGNIHTNGMENFWGLFKRGLRGTYVSVEPFHLFRYIDEEAFRYNYRNDMTDSDDFRLAMSHIVGKCLTYAELTGKVGASESTN
jgi:transposase-like protein